jgi:hypothetical protein
MIEIVVSKLAPLLFDLALDLLPVSFNPIPIHWNSPSLSANTAGTRAVVSKSPTAERPQVHPRPVEPWFLIKLASSAKHRSNRRLRVSESPNPNSRWFRISARLGAVRPEY